MKSSTFELGLTKKKSSGRRFYCSQCFGIERYTFHLRAMQIETKENFNLRKKINSHRIGLSNQHGRRFIVLENQYGGLTSCKLLFYDTQITHNHGGTKSSTQ